MEDDGDEADADYHDDKGAETGEAVMEAGGVIVVQLDRQEAEDNISPLKSGRRSRISREERRGNGQGDEDKDAVKFETEHVGTPINPR